MLKPKRRHRNRDRLLLVLWGGKDKLIPPAVGAQFARDIIGAHAK